MKLGLGKSEKLKSKKLLQQLFAEGQQLKEFPIKLLFLQTDHNGEFPAQVAFSVPKRNFKLAVKRNRIKRLMREVYRQQKPRLYEQLNKPHIFMFIFMGSKDTDYSALTDKMERLVSRFLEKNT